MTIQLATSDSYATWHRLDILEALEGIQYVPMPAPFNPEVDFSFSAIAACFDFLWSVQPRTVQSPDDIKMQQAFNRALSHLGSLAHFHRKNGEVLSPAPLARSFQSDCLNKMVQLLGANPRLNIENPSWLYELAEKFLSIMRNIEMEPSLKADLLSLPSWNEMMEHFKNAPVYPLPTIIAARRTVMKFLAKEVEYAWAVLDVETEVSQNYFDPLEEHAKQKKAALRALRQVALAYLMKADSEEYIDGIIKMFYLSKDPEKCIIALTILCDHPAACPSIKFVSKAIRLFAEWSELNPKVLDDYIPLWIKAQAGSVLAFNLELMNQLIDSEVFDWTNHDYVEAFFVTFIRNVPCFHEKSGQGYRLFFSQLPKIARYHSSLAADCFQEVSTYLNRLPEPQNHLLSEALSSYEKKRDSCKPLVRF